MNMTKIVTNKRTGHSLIDVSNRFRPDGEEEIMIRTATGAGWGLPTSNFDPDDFRKLADHLEEKRMAKRTPNEMADTLATAIAGMLGRVSEKKYGVMRNLIAATLAKHEKNVRLEQDRDTRHACAELVAGMPSLNIGLAGIDDSAPNMAKKDDLHDAIMNCKGGIE